jgi:hypothetical protein
MIHITFADRFYFAAANSLSSSMAKFDISTSIFTPFAIGEEFKRKNFQILQEEKGAGLWLWKPYFIKLTLQSLEDGQILFYTDAGCEVISDPRNLITILNDSDIGLFELTDKKEKFYTKSNVINHFELRQDQCNAPMRLASFLLFRKSCQSISFVNEWLEICTKKFLLDDSLRNEIQGFIDHRHDQSILSCLSKIRNIQAHRDPSQYGNDFINKFPDDTYLETINHTRSNNLTLYRKFKKSVLPKINFLKSK